jgi:catechol 2,3-dioxygenase-like lactoylglutathione lyase family enzyme
MKRFHVHVAVKDLDQSKRFYSAMFGAEPTVVKPDYAKWMLDDPRINFAISQRGSALGVNHLGVQADTDEELAAIHTNLQRADGTVVAEKGAQCCYATSDKYWVTDPQGIAWESFRSLGTVPFYGEENRTHAASPATDEPGTCCGPTASVRDEARASCCAKG